MKKILFYTLMLLVFSSCEKDAEIEIPAGELKPVVYGWI
jgi:hypothetical protein